MRRQKTRIILISAGLSLLLASCSVIGTEFEVSVDHLADKIGVAELAAKRHCEQYGRSARLVKTGPIKSAPSGLMLQTRTSTFDCVEP